MVQIADSATNRYAGLCGRCVIEDLADIPVRVENHEFE
jgi:hypothetical protein